MYIWGWIPKCETATPPQGKRQIHDIYVFILLMVVDVCILEAKKLDSHAFK